MPIEERRRLEREGFKVQRTGGLFERSRDLLKKPGKTYYLSPWKGLLLLLGTFVLALLFSLFGPYQLVFISIFIVSVACYLIDYLGIAVCVSYSFFYMFFIIPFRTSRDPGLVISTQMTNVTLRSIDLSTILQALFHLSSVIFTVVIAISLVLTAKRKKRIHIIVQKPLLSLIPLMLATSLVAIPSFFFIPILREQNQIRSEKYNFELTKPFKWRAEEEKPFLQSEKEIRKNADVLIELSSPYLSLDHGSYEAWLHIYIYSRMPFTGEPLTNYPSREEVYERLKSVLQDVVNNPNRYLEILDSKEGIWQVAEFQIYGKTKIDGVDAIKLAYREYWNNEPPEEPLPSGKDADIVVYKSPYLYWLEFHAVNEKTYKKIVNSFKFIK